MFNAVMRDGFNVEAMAQRQAAALARAGLSTAN